MNYVKPVVQSIAIFAIFFVVGAFSAQKAFAEIAEGNADPVEYCEVVTTAAVKVLEMEDTQVEFEAILDEHILPYKDVWNDGLYEATFFALAFAPSINFFEGTSLYEIQRKQVVDPRICIGKIEMHALVHGYDLSEGYPGPTATESEAIAALMDAF